MNDPVSQRVDAMRNKLAEKVKKFDRPIFGYSGEQEPDR